MTAPSATSQRIDGDERVDEIAAMLDGVPLTEASRANARVMLEPGGSLEGERACPAAAAGTPLPHRRRRRAHAGGDVASPREGCGAGVSCRSVLARG